MKELFIEIIQNIKQIIGLVISELALFRFRKKR